MTPSMWIGAVAGLFAGWIVGAVFTKGPKTPMEAVSGDYESGGLGCFAFLVLIAVFVGGGVIAGAILGGGG
ncbi:MULTISPECIES: hypothetical protein [Hyphomonas]|jgi:hypothetical protein|uniref:hypothetical protein n=1 Tax=Hyphomonas TaxID=85 RepID=UPI002356D8BC|nr:MULTISPECIES: hypothetical protein [Hyphomonas]